MQRALGTILFAATMWLAATPARPEEVALVVIVHRDRTDQLTRDDLARIYLKQRRFWDDGAPLVPLNREPSSAARETFSTRVLGGESAYFASYWNQQYFDGVFPPATLSSSAAIKRYVATNRNAIGYIEPSEVDPSVRVVLRIGGVRP